MTGFYKKIFPAILSAPTPMTITHPQFFLYTNCQKNVYTKLLFCTPPRYKREPVLVTETIRNVTHSGVIREIDCSMALVLLIASLAVMRYMTGELDNPGLRLIGGAAMIALIMTRAFVSRTKRSVI